MANQTQVRRTAAEKAKEALELRTLGYSFQEIADEVGYASKGSAHNAVAKALANIPREAADQARELELGRLDQLQTAAMNAALGGDLFAIDRVIKVIETRSRLLGLDKLPEQVDPGAAQARQALTDFLTAAKASVAPDPVPDGAQP